MSLLPTINARGLLAARPAAAAANEGYNYYATDDGILYRSNGSSWDVNSAGFANPMTTAGDIMYGGASGTPTRLGIGTAAQVLKVNAGATAPEWAAESGGSTYPTPWSLVPDSGAEPIQGLGLGLNNRTIYVPVLIPVALTVTGIRFVVTTTHASNLTVALYNSAGSRVATSAATAVPAVGRASVLFSSSYSAAAGRYYLAIGAENAAASFGAVTGAGLATMMGRYQNTYPPPATATFAGETSNTPALLGLVSGGYPT